MVKAKAFTNQGEARSAIELPAALFEQQVNEHLLYLAVKSYLANQRQGTAKVKSRVEVSGGGRKPWRQKGTGRARAGSNPSPLGRGGGRAPGPEPRDYRLEMPKKQRRASLTSALSLRAQEESVAVLGDLALEAPKTGQVAGLLKKIGLDGKKTLLVFAGHDENVFRSCRNLRGLRATLAHQVTPYHVLDCETVVFTDSGLRRLTEVFAS